MLELQSKTLADHRRMRDYRPEIDGLRAVAVTLVILFHYGVKPFRGGFIGVDVFFIISGYLITSIIVASLQADGFSFRHFYARRIKRIAPALFAATAATLAAGWYLSTPSDFRSLGLQAATGLFGLSNFHFFTSAGYFAKGADTMPLLHTWSLGIEEQFYLFWPAVLFLTWRTFRSIRAPSVAIGVIAALSFICSVIAVAYAPVGAFYLLPSRAWELALGGLMVFANIERFKINQFIIDGIGIALILASAFVIRDEWPFPGAAALPACIGAALIVSRGRTWSPVRSLLSVEPAQFIGRISYSLYLWHWPMVVFFHGYNGDKPSPVATAGLIAATVVIAWVSFLWIEEPFRRARRPFVIPCILAATALAAIAAVAIVTSDGFADRFPSQVAYYDSFTGRSAFSDFDYNCFEKFQQKAPDAEIRKCLAPVDRRPNVLLLGDSHAAHMGAGLAAVFPDVHFVAVSTSSCKPMLEQLKRKHASDCVDAFSRTLEKFAPEGLFDGIVIAARWRTGSFADLPETIRFLKKTTSQVSIIGPVHELRVDVPDALTAEFVPRGYTPKSMSDFREIDQLDDKLRAAVAGTGADYYSALDAECSQAGDCRLLASDGSPIASDYGHLTPTGSKDIVEAFKRAGLRFQSYGQ